MTRRSRKALVIAAAAALTVLALGAGINGTLAYFTDQASVNAGTTAGTAFTSGAIATPATPTVTAGTPAGQVNVSWTATAVSTGAGNTTATSYDVLRYPTATGGTATVVCSGVTGTSCTGATVAGTAYFAVRARFQANWTNEGARRSFVHNPDTTPPTVAINTDVFSCNNGVVCGTASDTGGGTVALVEYTFLRRVTQGRNTSYDCWNGSTWLDVAQATCTPWRTATGTTSWRVPGNQDIAFAMQGGRSYSYTLTVRATDSFGNVGTDTETQTLN